MMSSNNLLPQPVLEYGDQRAFKQVSTTMNSIKTNTNK